MVWRSFATLLSVAAAVFSEVAEHWPTTPNIIVALADDFGFGDVTSYGGEVPAPHLDRTAREEMRFTQFYVASPIPPSLPLILKSAGYTLQPIVENGVLAADAM